MQRRLAPSLVFLIAPLGLACGDNLAPSAADAAGPRVLATPAECNPLGGTGCVTPWPSSIYLRDDATSVTGVRLDLAPGAMPPARDGELDVAPFNVRTGFSPAAQIFTVFPGGVDPSNLVGWDDLGASITAASPTLIVDMETGEPVAHFAEVDANTRNLDLQALYLRPAARLLGGRRYAVGIRKRLKAAGGGELASPEGFAAIVAGEVTSHARLEAVRPRYDAIFTALAEAGAGRDDLVVAWDFVTADDASLLADTQAARDAALVAMGELGVNLGYRITTDDRPFAGDPTIVRRIIVEYEVPNLIAGEDGRGGFIRDADGTPIVDGVSLTEAVIMIPACATTAAAPVPVLLFGHGFFGGLDEAQGGYLRRVASELCMVVVGGRWRGMSTDDLNFAAAALADGNQVLAYGHRIVQGIVDFIALEQLVRGKLGSEVIIDVDGDVAGPAGAPPRSLIDPTKVYFYGISQGAILGSTFVAWDPFITRSVHHVGGAEWGLLFERSTNWAAYVNLVKATYESALDVVIEEQVLQMGFDFSDPVHVAPRVLTDPLPGTPQKHFLHHMSVGDAQVTNLASQLQARTMGLPVLGSTPLLVPYGMTAAAGPLTDAFVPWTEEPTPLPPVTNKLNGTDNAAHNDLRRRAAVVEQIGTFLETGEIVDTCGGAPCNCAAGACGDLR